MKYIKEDIKEILKDFIPNFTTKHILAEVFNRGWKYCSSGWVTEVLKELGYEYNKNNKYWFKKPIIIDSISLSAHNESLKKLREERDNLKELVEHIENRLAELLKNITNDDFCNKCKKRIFCKKYQYPSKLGILDICNEHKESLNEIDELLDIINMEKE